MSLGILTVKFITSLALLFALTFVVGLLLPYFSRIQAHSRSVLSGLLFGIFGGIAALTAAEIMPGFFLDVYTIMVAVASAFGGIVCGLIAAGVVSLIRIVMGGGGTAAAVMAVFTAVWLGYLVYRYHARRGTNLDVRSLLLLGFASAVPRLIWTVAVGGSAGQEVAAIVALPVLLVYPMGTVALGWLLGHQQQHFRTEMALRESEERYRSVITAMKEGVVVWDADATIHAFNPGAEHILGVTGDQLLGMQSNVSELRLIHADGTPFPLAELPHRLALKTGEPQNDVVIGVFRLDNSLVWLLVNARPLFRPGDPKPYGALATFADITEAKTTMETLVSERDLLRTLIDSTPDYIFIKDADGRFVISNEAHARAANMSVNQLLGKTAFDVFPPHLAEQFHADDMEIIKSGQQLLNLERTTVDAQGNFKTVLTTKVPLRNREGRITGLVGISRDITERKLVERQALELAAERERMKVLQRFIGDLSHDFRTPLTIINNSVYLLRKITDPERQQAQLDKLEAQVIRMDGLLGDLLKMDHLVHGESPYSFKLLNLNTLVSDVVAVLDVVAAEKSQKLQFMPYPDLPLVKADYNQLKQAVASVIENAVHYTPESGEIKVHTEIQNHQVAVVVADSGIGIPQEDWSHIFEPFFRADQARSTTGGRSGLGLAISKSIVEAHNGSIGVQSTVGQGSIFTILLPSVTADLF